VINYRRIYMAIGSPDWGKYPDRFDEAGKQYALQTAFIGAVGNVVTSASNVYDATSWPGIHVWMHQAAETVSFDFYGAYIAVVLHHGPSDGKVEVYIDGSLNTTIDCYSADEIQSYVTLLSASLERTSHTIRLDYTGTKNASSSGTNIYVEGFIVDQSTMPANVPPNAFIANTYLRNAFVDTGILVKSDSHSTPIYTEITDGTTDAEVDATTKAVKTLEQGTPTVHLQGWTGSAWKDVAVDADGKLKVV
jgi:hypothetical protein